ncbi:MAG: RNA-protein complex protein Nop10 [Candidatus Nitrosocaldus sp.]|nr:RNA-protein complex protein Nop10 [Candidatus Nitrosocaldus sp.]MCS7141193.1 RNA-protein complex protein Nop10 [Candidatus Nitrosocaldus sp.]MDW8000201.1 RNA-protein complex protein Nop10 [Candidatus Nitrosocaldus sp.]MDW8275796.1 RNA-protein complex protein Nop10 [Candidatus Nitrosocaldus sp.]
MRRMMRRCPACRIYTLKQECPRCNGATHDPHPPRFSPDDRYARYRIAERYRKIGEDGDDSSRSG